MIQRIQSLYLLLVVVVSAILTQFLSLWKWKETVSYYINDAFSQSNKLVLSITIAFYAVAIMAVVSLFLFKNRKLQFVFNRLNILINLFLVGAIVFLLLTLSGENQISEKGIGSFLPIINIVLLVFANKAIKKDEELVKSVDRIR